MSCLHTHIHTHLKLNASKVNLWTDRKNERCDRKMSYFDQSVISKVSTLNHHQTTNIDITKLRDRDTKPNLTANRSNKIDNCRSSNHATLVWSNRIDNYTNFTEIRISEQNQTRNEQNHNVIIVCVCRVCSNHTHCFIAVIMCM